MALHAAISGTLATRAHTMNRSTLRARILIGIFSAGYAFPAAAAAPIYFDIVGTLLYILCAIFGVIIFPSWAAFSQSRENKRLFWVLAIVCIGLCAAPILAQVFSDWRRKADLQANADAFAQYCAGARRPVIYPELVTSPVSIMVRHEHLVTKPERDDHALEFIPRIWRDESFCKRSAVASITFESATANQAKPYLVCRTRPNAAGTPVEYDMFVQAYESEKKDNTHVMYKSLIVLTRKADKKVVAAGDFYFVEWHNAQIEARCPNNTDAILPFLATAFPKGGVVGGD